MVKGIVIAARTLRRMLSTSGRSRRQSRAAVALHNFVDRAAEVDIHDIEAEVLARFRRVGHYLRIGAEKLRGNGVLFRFKIQIAEGARRLPGFE